MKSQNIYTRCGILCFNDLAFHIGTEIRFCQNHYRYRTAVVCNGQIPFQASDVKVAVQRHTDQCGINIGGDDLLTLSGARRFSDKEALSWK